MGGICSSSSKDVVLRMEEQEKKIDNLIHINKDLEQKLNELQAGNINEPKQTNDKNDLTNLKTTIDLRFNKLEKTVENLHNDFKLKLFEGIIDNMKGENDQINESLDLDFAKEKNLRQSNHYTIKTPQNEGFKQSEAENKITNYNQIRLDINGKENINSPGASNDFSTKKNPKSLAETAKDILEDEDIKRIHAHVRNTMFKGSPKS